jgi:4'-phosphopantetheinyl transferase
MPVYQTKNISASIILGVWKITEQKEELLNQLFKIGFDKSTIYQPKNEQRLKQWLATRLLLSVFLKNSTIIYDELGKPYLDNDWKISISHSNEFVAIILNNNDNCGIDIEKISNKVARIKHKFLTHLDLKTVITNKHLTLYWGAKEALYKYYGKKEVLFKENLFIEDFSENSKSFSGRIDMPEFKKTLPMKYEIIEDYILTYTL